MIEDHRVFLGLLDGAFELAQRLRVAALLVERPAETVDEIPVVGLEVERLRDQRHRLVEVDALLREHVAHVVVGLGVGGIDPDHLAEGADRVVKLRLLLQDHTELEEQILVLGFEREPFLNRRLRAVVLLRAVVGGAEVEEELGPAGFEINGLLEERDRLVEALEAAIEEAELHAGVDRLRIRVQDLLELLLRLSLLPRVHVGRGEEVPRAQVRGFEGEHAAEGLGGLVPLLLLVVDGAKLHEHPRVAGGLRRQALDLRLRFLVPAEPDEEVAEPLDEGGVFGIGLDGLAVYLDGFLGLAPSLVGVAERGPGAVVLGIELDGAPEPRDGLVPLLLLDGEPPQQEVRLGEGGLHVDQPQQHAARAVVGLPLDEEPGERQIGVGRLGIQRDDPLELRLRLREPLLGAQEFGEREAGRRVVGRELHGLSRGGQRLLALVQTGQPLGELAPQDGRPRIAPDRLAELRHRLLEAGRLRVHLRDRVVVVRLGRRVGRDARDLQRERGVGVARGGRRARASGHKNRQDRCRQEHSSHAVPRLKRIVRT